MKESSFIINGRFVIDSEKNELLDSETKEKKRLEPRIMKLLCLLTEQRTKVVYRESIINKIWYDYPGANEGLNQAISFLRKHLKDEQKSIIQTLPKSGYIFNADITYGYQSVRLKKYSGMMVTASALLIVALITGYFYLRKNVQEVNINEKRNVEISRLDSIHQAELIKKYSIDTTEKSSKKDSLLDN